MAEIFQINLNNSIYYSIETILTSGAGGESFNPVLPIINITDIQNKYSGIPSA